MQNRSTPIQLGSVAGRYRLPKTLGRATSCHHTSVLALQQGESAELLGNTQFGNPFGKLDAAVLSNELPATLPFPVSPLVSTDEQSKPVLEIESDLEPAAVSPIAEVEALLWLSDEPLAIRKLVKMANLKDASEAKKLINLLQQQHRARRCAFEITEVAGGYQLLTQPQFVSWLSKVGVGDSQHRLSDPSMEALAIVAYRQPVLRAEVEAIRGVGCGELLRQLLDSDLLRIVGRSEELGRPLLYGTTKRFLQLFGLRNLDGLSQMAGVREPEEPTKKDAPGVASQAA